jgi:predicted patatin/cPLA2 family phospholipase
MTTTLMLEGGGLRGAFGAGVVAELASCGSASFDDVLAVSSGAPTAAYLVAGQADDGLRIWEEHTHGAQLISPARWLRREPLMDLPRLVGVFARGVPLVLPRLATANARCWVVVTRCATGAADYLRATPENVLDLLHATMAIPIAYGRAVEVDGTSYVDGGIADAVPIDHALSLGNRRTVVVLTRPRGYRRSRSRVAAFLMGKSYPRYPALGSVLARRWATSNRSLETIERLEEDGAISVIRPSATLPAGRLSRRREDILATIEAGRASARAWLRSGGLLDS